jgi:hypothetical protein
MVWKLISITCNKPHYLCFCSGLCKNVVFHRHVCIVFLLNQPIATVLSSYPSMTLTIGHFEHSYWLTWEKYARDDERLHFCINLNNIDNEVYCDFIVMLTSFQTISSINYYQSNYTHTWNTRKTKIQSWYYFACCIKTIILPAVYTW